MCIGQEEQLRGDGEGSLSLAELVRFWGEPQTVPRGWGSLRCAVLRISFYFSSHPVLHNQSAPVLQPFLTYIVH